MSAAQGSGLRAQHWRGPVAALLGVGLFLLGLFCAVALQAEEASHSARAKSTPSSPSKAASGKEEQILAKLNEVLEKQEHILKRFDEVMAELQIIKIRATIKH